MVEFVDVLDIFGRPYTVWDTHKTQKMEGVMGCANYISSEIYLDHSLDLGAFLQTAWHEAIHIAQQDLHGQPDESQARWMSVFIHQFLVHNPEIIELYQSLSGLAGEYGGEEDDEDGA